MKMLSTIAFTAVMTLASLILSEKANEKKDAFEREKFEEEKRRDRLIMLELEQINSRLENIDAKIR